MKNLLIVGDWLVDDNWLTGAHRSSTSLRIGSRHQRALHLPGCPVQAFCGAGRLASILHDARLGDSPDPSFTITGIGVWTYRKELVTDEQGKPIEAIIDDTALLHSMFDFDFRKKQGPSSLSSEPLIGDALPKNVILHNIAECLITKHAEEKFTTTRVYRVFQKQEGNPVLLSRTDWEQPPKKRDTQGAPEWVCNDDREDFEGFLRKHGINAGNIDAVIVKDLIKGVVSWRLIDVLARELPKVPWFVSTKRWKPTWLERLGGVDVRLFLVPPVAATDALSHGRDLDSWIVSVPAPPGSEAAKPTKAAMQQLTELERKVCPDDQKMPLVAVSPGEGSVLAKEKGWFVVEKRKTAPNLSLVGWATAFFAALCAHLLSKEEDINGEKKVRRLTNGEELEQVISQSLDFANEWSTSEAEYLVQPDKEDHDKPAVVELIVGTTPSIPDPPTTTPREPSAPSPSSPKGKYDWTAEYNQWVDAHRTGIIEKTEKGEKRKYLDLWRAMTALPGYVCLESAKCQQLSHLANALRDFAKGIDRHQAVHVVASPGSGKSYLVECLAKASKLRHLVFNVTHLNGREDIISCFDTIVTTQASEGNRPLLVFFDEINALVAGHHVYDAFLSPLEESLYVRGGQRFHIKPCVWMFAGTEDETIAESATKYVDFCSRLTEGKIALADPTQLEKLYLGAQLVVKRFPEVQRISRGALDLFQEVKGSVRELRFKVDSLQNVQGGRVSKANFPDQKDGLIEENENDFVDVA
ncbi:MAG: AAA family ATPase [Planctomycetaceae bacterium]|nr:AAA family ATPase [Planctomycetaceae bacterium]